VCVMSLLLSSWHLPGELQSPTSLCMTQSKVQTHGDVWRQACRPLFRPEGVRSCGWGAVHVSQNHGCCEVHVITEPKAITEHRSYCGMHINIGVQRPLYDVCLHRFHRIREVHIHIKSKATRRTHGVGGVRCMVHGEENKWDNPAASGLALCKQESMACNRSRPNRHSTKDRCPTPQQPRTLSDFVHL
jgi:hypothetical protein